MRVGGSARPLRFSCSAAGAADNANHDIDVDSSAGSLSFSIGTFEKMRLDSSGRLLVGTSIARSNIDISTSLADPQFQVEGTGFSNSSISVIRNTTATGSASARIFLGKSNGASVGSNVIVTDNDLLGQIVFNGNDGTNFIEFRINRI